jgi:hypothetical protein
MGAVFDAIHTPTNHAKMADHRVMPSDKLLRQLAALTRTHLIAKKPVCVHVKTTL